MRSAINAVVAFGALPVHVGVAPTASRKEVKLRTLHVDCGTPVKQFYRCPECDMSLSSKDQVKGYEIAKGKFVIVESLELEQAAAPKSNLIELTKFVDESDLEPNLVEKSYYLVPRPEAILRKTYEIVAASLESDEVVGLGKACLWKKEYPIAVSTNQGVLHLHMLFCADELVSDTEIVSNLLWDVSPEERELASMFIGLKKGTLTLEDLTTASRDRVMTLIELKASGEKILITESDPLPDPPTDYIAALRESVALAAAGRREELA